YFAKSHLGPKSPLVYRLPLDPDRFEGGLPAISAETVAASTVSGGGVGNRQPLTNTVGVPCTPIFAPRANPAAIRATLNVSETHRENSFSSETRKSFAKDRQGFRPSESCFSNARSRNSPNLP